MLIAEKYINNYQLGMDRYVRAERTRRACHAMVDVADYFGRQDRVSVWLGRAGRVDAYMDELWELWKRRSS